MANKIAKKELGTDHIIFKWADETTSEVFLNDLPESLIDRAALHGLSQKLGDSYASSEGNLAIAKAAFDEVLTALKAGDWNRKGGGSTGGIWVEALAQAVGVSLEEALEKWNAMDDATKASIRKHADVKLAKAEIEMKRAKAAVKGVKAEPLKI